MASTNEKASLIPGVWEVNEHIYNADEFELEKEDEEPLDMEDENHEDNEGQGEDTIENVTDHEAIVYDDEVGGSLKPHVGMIFDSEEEACDYYNRYAYQKGFSVRKGAVRKSEKDGSIIGRRLLCSQEGFRIEKEKNKANKKKHRGETRCGFPAKLLVNKSSDGSWVVSVFNEEHNHMLATPRKCHLLPSHRKIS